MSICGNFVELIDAKKVQNDEDFIIWDGTNLHENTPKNFTIKVYVEKEIIKEFSHKELVIIDATTRNVDGQVVGMLYIKRDQDKYGI